jgi:hypothetical protein
MSLALGKSQLTFLIACLPFILPAKQDMLTSYLRTFGNRTPFGIVVDVANDFRKTID